MDAAAPVELIKRFKDASIAIAAVVDETFDPPELSSVEAELPTFQGEINADPELKDELQEKGIRCDTEENFVRFGLAQLWEKRSAFDDGPLASHIETLFHARVSAGEEAEAVATHLENLGLKVHRLGAKDKIPDNAKLVFLDYDLEPRAQGVALRKGTKISEQRAKELALRENDAPFLVLFSSQTSLSSIAKRFRKKAKYLGGTFAFLPKSEVKDPQPFFLQLQSFGVGHPVLIHTKKFFLALTKRLEEVVRSLGDEVMGLDVQDYAFIQNLGLADDGEPLGEYLLDLFGSALSHELRDGADVQAMRHKLDELHFDRHLPFSSQPSVPVQRLYRAALTDPGVGPTKFHPLAKGLAIEEKSKDGTVRQRPYPAFLRLGDIFASTPEKPVYLVVNPACDLQYSPRNKTRQPALSMPIYLLPGRLQPLRQTCKNPAAKRMDFFEFQDRKWRIVWDPACTETVPLGKFDKWQRAQKYQRVSRLSLPYALALQQFWTSQLSRVGLAVNLPFYEACAFQIFIPQDETSWVKLGPQRSGEIILARHPRDSGDAESFTFTEKGRTLLKTKLNEAKAALEAQATVLKDAQKQKELGKVRNRITAAELLLADWNFWADLIEVKRDLERSDKWSCKCVDALVFQWEREPTDVDLRTFQKAAVVVVLHGAAAD